MISNEYKDKIYIYDVFTDLYEDKHRLLPNELYIYCYLYRNRRHDYITNTSVESIHQMMPVKFYPSVESKNRMLIKEVLDSLVKKGIILVDNEPESLMDNKKGNYIPFNVTFNQFTQKKGHLRITYSDFDTTEDINYFYIWVAVKRFDDVKTACEQGGRWISEKEFGLLIGKNKKTFRNYADDMISKGLLYKKPGIRLQDSLQQDKNIYKTVPFVYEKKEVNVVQVEPDTKDKQSKETRDHCWYSTDRNIFPDTDDYYIYLTTKDQNLVKHAEKRIAAFRKSEYGSQKVNKCLEDAERKIHAGNKQKQRIERSSIIKEYGYVFELEDGSNCLLKEIKNKDYIENFHYLNTDWNEAQSTFRTMDERLQILILDKIETEQVFNPTMIEEISSKFEKIKEQDAS